jgi:hypothetical protein
VAPGLLPAAMNRIGSLLQNASKKVHLKIDISLLEYSNSHAAGIFGFPFDLPAGVMAPPESCE